MMCLKTIIPKLKKNGPWTGKGRDVNEDAQKAAFHSGYNSGRSDSWKEWNHLQVEREIRERLVNWYGSSPFQIDQFGNLVTESVVDVHLKRLQRIELYVLEGVIDDPAEIEKAVALLNRHGIGTDQEF